VNPGDDPIKLEACQRESREQITETPFHFIYNAPFRYYSKQLISTAERVLQFRATPNMPCLSMSESSAVTVFYRLAEAL